MILRPQYSNILHNCRAVIDFYIDIVTEMKKMTEEKQTKVDVIQEEDSSGVVEVPVPEQFSPEK